MTSFPETILAGIAPSASEAENIIKSQRPVVAMALKKFPPAADFTAAMKRAFALHRQGECVLSQANEAMLMRVKEEYQRIVAGTPKAETSNQRAPLNSFESEEMIEASFEAARAVSHAALQKLAREQTPHSVAIHNGISEALHNLAKSFEASDAACCKRLGVALSYSNPTRIVHGVQIQFTRRVSVQLLCIASLKPTQQSALHAKRLFEDFLDLSAW